MNISRRGAKTLGAVALAVLPLALSTPASAASHTVSLTVGPVPIPGLPLSACVDDVCTPTGPVTGVELTAAVTSDSLLDIDPVLLTPALCPIGEVGVAIRVTPLTVKESVSITASVKVTGPDGPTEVTVGPVEKTVGLSTPGLLISACTES